MQYAAIPTTYNGIEFRSRLEAKWAFMFDEFDLPWEYEPVDMDGYIPDFSITLGESVTFVEVKPAFTSDSLISMCEKAVRCRDSHKCSFLFLGATPFLPLASDPGYVTGVLAWFHPQLDGPEHPYISRMSDAYLNSLDLLFPWGIVSKDELGFWFYDGPYGRKNIEDDRAMRCQMSQRHWIELKWKESVNATKYRHRRHA